MSTLPPEPFYTVNLKTSPSHLLSVSLISLTISYFRVSTNSTQFPCRTSPKRNKKRTPYTFTHNVNLYKELKDFTISDKG